MVCRELFSSPRLEGVRVLIIARVPTKQLNFRAYDVEKVMVQFSNLQCDQIFDQTRHQSLLGGQIVYTCKCNLGSNANFTCILCKLVHIVIDAIILSGFNYPTEELPVFDNGHDGDGIHWV